MEEKQTAYIIEDEDAPQAIDWKQKLSSRVFWICLAAFLAAVATAIANTFAGNETAATVAGVCSVIAAGIYAAAEKAVDIARIKADTVHTEVIHTESESVAQTKNVEAKSDDVMTVAAVLAPAPVMEDE